MKQNKIYKLYKDLRKKHGKPQDQWQLWCRRPKTKAEREEVMVGAILTQQANWKNVDLAMDNLKKARKAKISAICALGKKDIQELAALIRPSGFYQQKANYLFYFAKFICEKNKIANYFSVQPLEKLRKEFLSLKGIGPETADSILLYALDKPIFVIDEYTRRLAKRYRLAYNMDYAYLQKLFESKLKKDYRLYQDFHALIVIEGKNFKK
jgi:endonuclease-3 related protein